MKQVRLLPIVIAAGAALLVLKGFGIMTGGGYVLTGPTQVQAAGGGAAPKEAAAGAENATMSMPVEPTMLDESPMMDDGAPTLSLSGDDGGHGDSSGGHGEAAADDGHGDDAAADAHGDDAADDAHGEDEAGHGEGDVPALTDGDHADGEHAEAGPSTLCPEGEQSVIFASPDGGGCMEALDETGVATPMEIDAQGMPVPIQDAASAAGSEGEVLERLAERRDELDTRAAELEMRLALVEAAEKRINERTAALEVLEARINAMVDEKRALEEAQFTSLVSMYETMKPKDAAAIFDELDPSVLLRVARAINPRKMGPIMAKMSPMKARDLTSGMAVDQVEPTIDLASENLAALPQIVGQ